MRLTISAPPHIRENISLASINWGKIIALLPISLAAVYFFGLHALAIIVASIASAVITEAAIQIIFKQPLTIGNGNAAFVGLLLALIIPPEVPLWIPVIGSFFAMALVVHGFGGIGSYFFNPVLASWVFLTMAWWSLMKPVSTAHIGTFSDLLLDSGAGIMAEVSPIALLAGVALIAARYVEWRIPISYAVTTLVLATVLHEDLSYVLTGAFVLATLFIVTDTPTSPVTKKGRIIYGITAGVFTVIYGYYSNYALGVMYAIFFANCLTAFIEKHTMPKPFGGSSHGW